MAPGFLLGPRYGLLVAIFAVVAANCLPVSCFSQVRKDVNGESICPIDKADSILRITPRKPLYNTCIPQGEEAQEWNRVLLVNLVSGNKYHIRFSYVAKTTHVRVFDLKLETVFSDGTSVFTEGDDQFNVKVFFKQNRSLFSDSGGTWGWLRRPGPDTEEATQSEKRELIDTEIKFLNPMHDLKHLHVTEVYLHIRIRTLSLPSGEVGDELGVLTKTERLAGQHSTRFSDSKQDRQNRFFEFDLLVAEKKLTKVTVDFIPIILTCATFFLVMNVYIIRRWHRNVSRAPDPVSPYFFTV